MDIFKFMDKHGWKMFSVSYMDLSKGISEIIPKIEKEV